MTSQVQTLNRKKKRKKPLTDEQRQKASLAMKKAIEEGRIKPPFYKGYTPWNKGKPAWNRGKPWPLEVKAKISQSMRTNHSHRRKKKG